MAKGEADVRSVNHDEWIKEKLKDPDFAAEYLNAAADEDDSRIYLTALRQVVEARGGIKEIAEKTQLSKETLYRTLSSRGNPTIKTLSAVLRAAGLKMAVTAV